MNWKILAALFLSVYAVILSTYTFYIDRAGRLKIIADTLPNCLMTDGSQTTLYQFTIVNISYKKRIIDSVTFQFNTIKDNTYGSMREVVKRTPLDLGESILYELYRTDFDIISKKLMRTNSE
jgi:hypothetical protein